MKPDMYTPISLRILDMCEDGEEVDHQDLFVRGFPVTRQKKYTRIKIKGKEGDMFTTKNLTVFAHAFEPVAREKIESLGGRCIRLHEVANIPVDESFQPAPSPVA